MLGFDIVGCRVLDDEGHIQSDGGTPTVLLGLVRHRRQGRPDRPPRRSYQRTSWVHGASVLVSRDAWRLLDGFDRNYFLYYEETDLCFRARQAGLNVGIAFGARVRHKGSLSFGGALGANSTRDLYLSRNYVRFAKRHVHPAMFIPVVTCWALTVCAVRLVRGQVQRTRTHTRGLWLGLHGHHGRLA